MVNEIILLLVASFFCGTTTFKYHIHKFRSYQILGVQIDPTTKARLKQLTTQTLGPKVAEEYTLLQNSRKQIVKGRCELYDCIRIDETNDVLSEVFKAKVVKDLRRFDAERANQRAVQYQKHQLVFAQIKIFELSPELREGVIILESGLVDLKQASVVKGSVRGKKLKRIARQMATALQKVHAAGLVWTDLKLENFVMVPIGMNSLSAQQFRISSMKDYEESQKPQRLKRLSEEDFFSDQFFCKAIDLESAVATGDAMKDFSPETATPELVESLEGAQMSTQGGRGGDLLIGFREPVLAYPASDIWALGISILHLYLGRAPIVNRADVKGCIQKLSSYVRREDDLGLNEVDDLLLKRLLQSMLAVDPSRRPGINFVLSSLYFLAP